MSSAKVALRKRLAPYTCAAIILVFNLSAYAMQAPMVRMLELAVCREYYQAHNPNLVDSHGFVEETYCKLGPIQTKAAWLNMLTDLLNSCCDLIAAFPVSFLASRLGPKPAMLLNFGGKIMGWTFMISVCYFYKTFRANHILLSSLFTLFGGSSSTTKALIYAEAAFFSQNITATFSFLAASGQVPQLIGPAIGASILAAFGVFTAYYFTIPLALLSIPLTFCLPAGDRPGLPVDSALPPIRRRKETNSMYREDPGLDEQRRLITAEADSTPFFIEGMQNSVQLESPSRWEWPKQANIQHTITKVRFELNQFVRIFTNYRLIRFSFVALFVVTLAEQALHILMQYVSKRFHVTIAEAGYLFTIKAFTVLGLYTVLIPFGQRVLHTSLDISNQYLARISIVLLAVGMLIMGLSVDIVSLIPGLFIFALGYGYSVLIRGIVTAHASANDISVPLLYSGLVYAETLGSVVGTTVETAAFTSTIDRSGVIAGLPFLLCTAFFTLVGIPTFWMDLTPKREKHLPRPQEADYRTSDWDDDVYGE